MTLNPAMALNEYALRRLGTFFEWLEPRPGSTYQTVRPAAVRWDGGGRTGVLVARGAARPLRDTPAAAPRKMTDAPPAARPHAPPPPTNPAAAAATRGRLPLPPRGDAAATRYALVGLAFYVAAGASLIGALLVRSHGSPAAELLELFGLGKETNLTLFGLIALGVGLVILAGKSVAQDRKELAKEEDDVEWVNRHGRDGLGLVFAPANRREELFRRGQREYPAEAGGHVETLMDDRVRRLLEKADDAYLRVSPQELRAIAETRTARYGAFARYASSLLLLLAVLGTFAGVKTALPGLIDAVSSQGAGRIGTGDITAPLRAVADAFGGNALALVGAIAVGLMAQGLSTGRRSLLERLELVSTEFLYGTLQGDSVDPLVDAVRELSVTAESVRQAGNAIAGVEDAITALGATFDGAFERLNAQLVEVAERQDEALHERTSKEVRELQRRVVDLAAVVEQNTRGYQGIVDTVDERARESRAAIELVRQSAASLQEALQSVAAFQASAQRTAEGVQGTLQGLQAGVQQALGALLAGSEQATGRMEAVAASVERAQPAIDTVEELLRSVSDRVSTIDQRASAAWSSAAQEVNAQLGEMVKELRASNGRGEGEPSPMTLPASTARDAELAVLLRRVAAAVEAERGPSPRALVLAQGAGTLAALALGYGLFVLARAVVAWLG
ncbi:MAG: hypothetical protein ACJ8GN_28370 [Longimicrobiaceae bacterium]